MNELRTLIPYLRPYRWGLAAGLLMVVIANVFAVAAPLLLGQAIDALGRPDATRLLILGYAGLVVLAAVLSGAARFGMRQILNGLSRRVETDLRDAFFAHLLRLDAAFYGQTRTGDLMSRATNDTQAVRMSAGPALMYLVNTLVVSIFALLLMIRISPSLTAWAMLPMLLLPPIVLKFGRLVHQRFERIQDHLGRLSTLVQENLSGARIVRAYRQEATQEAEFETMNARYLEKNMALARVSALFHPLLSLLMGAGMIVVFWVGGLQIMAGTITTGDFVAFTFYLAMLGWPMIALGWVTNLFQRGAASMGRLNAIFQREPEVRSVAVAQPRLPAGIVGEIEFRDVRFRYPGTEREVLRGVSFRIPAGATAALVGPTGSGKSTIVALLARFYDATAGEVLIDGVPVQRLPIELVRRGLGIVPQDAFLFSETIEENLALGLEAEGAERAARVRAAAAVARLDETIVGFPAGYRTLLGERGINVSGGQRQRATLARALALEPRILVLDDALSAVDTHTEAEILHGLQAVMKERTSLVISHRVSAVMDADLILVLDDGRIVERGTHTGLLARGGLYATLLRRQLLSESLEEEDASPSTTAGAGASR
jgi:ATP-binding cassette, subfamily B, multidrug efflux pump